MKVRPVTRARKPKYPDKYELDAKKLLYYRPVRWKSAPIAGGVLTAVLALGLSACKPSELPLSIPIFEHGKGTGTIGCDSVASPVFLSEEEALAVIYAEFNSAGLTVIPEYDDYASPEKIGKITLDAGVYTGNGLIGIEYVSLDDHTAWDYTPPKNEIQRYDIIGTARLLSESNLSVAAFYDPVNDRGYIWRDTSETENMTDRERQAYWTAEAEKASKAELREQVRDFIDWLRAQGVI